MTVIRGIARPIIDRGALLGFALLLTWPLSACVTQEQAQANRAAAQAALEEKEDAQCRQGGVAPTSVAYENCRKELADKRAAEEAVREQRRESFQRTLGQGTSGGP
jgi:hypothetical protein